MVYYTEDIHANMAIKSALVKALNIIAENNDIKTIILLFSTMSVVEDVLSGVIPKNLIKNRCFHNENPSCGILIETFKTYSANTPHVLISVLIGEKDLTTIEDEWNAREWVVIPNKFELIENWLRVHSAENVITG